jgi:RNA polymerase sigma-70 factor (ECF subfamily)
VNIDVDTATVFRDHAAFAWRVLRRLGVPDSDVADVCQEVFLVVHRRLPEFEGRSQLRTWVYGICIRTASDYRKRGVRREIPTEAVPEESSTPSERPDEQLAMRQARARLDEVLDGLDDDKRAVFVLFEIERLSMKEVAESLECPLQTAYSRLHAARALVTDAVAKMRQEERRPA